MRTKKSLGATLIEAAIVMPLFVIFVLTVIDLGRYFLVYILLNHAAHEGVDFAAKLPMGVDLTECPAPAERNCDAADPTVWPPQDPPNVCDDYDRYVQLIVDRTLAQAQVVADSSQSDSWVKLLSLEHYYAAGQRCASHFTADVAFLRPGEKVRATLSDGSHFEVSHLTRSFGGETGQGWPGGAEAWDGVLNTNPLQVTAMAEFHPVLPFFPNVIVQASQLAFGGKKTFSSGGGDLELPTLDPCLYCPAQRNGQSVQNWHNKCVGCYASGCNGCNDACFDNCMVFMGPLGCGTCNTLLGCSKNCDICRPVACPPDGAGLNPAECDECVRTGCFNCAVCYNACVAEYGQSDYENCVHCNEATEGCGPECPDPCEACDSDDPVECASCQRNCGQCPTGCFNACKQGYIDGGMSGSMACTLCALQYPLCDDCDDPCTDGSCGDLDGSDLQRCADCAMNFNCGGCDEDCYNACVAAHEDDMGAHNACVFCNAAMGCNVECPTFCNECPPDVRSMNSCMGCAGHGCGCDPECFNLCVVTLEGNGHYPWDACTKCNDFMGCSIACPSPCDDFCTPDGIPDYEALCLFNQAPACPTCIPCGCACSNGGGGN